MKKAIPNKIGVFGAIYEVEHIDGLEFEGDSVNGLHCPQEKKILIEKDLSHEEKWHTFLHELGHSIVYRCSLNEADDWNDNFEHQMVEAFAKYFMRFLIIYEKLPIHNTNRSSAKIEGKARDK